MHKNTATKTIHTWVLFSCIFYCILNKLCFRKFTSRLKRRILLKCQCNQIWGVPRSIVLFPYDTTIERYCWHQGPVWLCCYGHMAVNASLMQAVGKRVVTNEYGWTPRLGDINIGLGLRSLKSVTRKINRRLPEYSCRKVQAKATCTVGYMFR